MPKHAKEEAMSTRTHVAAWLVFISMAGTTMSFQVYHSVKHGHMPWPLAVLYGVVPLLISMLLIEIVSGWNDAPKWIQWAAYLIIGGAMYLSAAATGAVVLRAAPSHSSLLFGLLLDGAAILAARYLMTAAKRAALSEQSVLEAALEAERSARAEAEAEREAVRQELAELTEAVTRAEARAEELARKLAALPKPEAARGSGRKRDAKPAGSGTGNERPVTAAVTAPGEPEEEAPEDLDSEARVLWFLDKGFSASQAGIKAGLTDSRGRQIARLAREAPRGIDEGGSQ